MAEGTQTTGSAAVPDFDSAQTFQQDRPRGDICAGCVELTQRVERLERRLAELDDPAPVTADMSTLLCYWLCVGFHVMVCFASFASENSISFGYLFTVGACGTLAVCHVLATRPIAAKLGRSLLSIAVVLLAITVSDWLSGQNNLPELLHASSIYIPLMIFGGWISAKALVWIRGWRIVPPGGSREFFKPSIRDLMLLTVMAAIVFGLFRFAVAEDVTNLASEWMVLICNVSVPVVTASLIGAFLARAILTPHRSVSLMHLLLVVVSGLGTVIILYSMLFGMAGDFEFSNFKNLLAYALMTSGIGMVSPLVTFALMRSAGYHLMTAAKNQVQT